MQIEITVAMQMRPASTSLDHTVAPVTKDTKEMASIA